MNTKRPTLISIVQYQDEIAAGTLTVLDVVDKLTQFDAAGVELRRESWPKYQSELHTVRDRLQSQGKMVTFATFSTLFSRDAAAHQMLLHDLDTAKALGSPLLRIFPGAIPQGTSDPAWRGAVEVVEYAASLGLVIALENFGKSPGGTSTEILHILNHIPLPALKTNIDIGNYATHGEDVAAAIHAVEDRAVYAHLKDKAGDRSDSTTYLGGGNLPMREIMATLNSLPQEVIYCFEFVGAGEADFRIEKSMAYLRELERQEG